jgi:hypothetical protein
LYAAAKMNWHCCYENNLSRGFAGFEGNFMSQGFQPFDQLTGQPLWLQAVEKVWAQFLVRCLSLHNFLHHAA